MKEPSYEYKGYPLKCPRCYYAETCTHKGQPTHEQCFTGFRSYNSQNPLGCDSQPSNAFYAALLAKHPQNKPTRSAPRTLEEFDSCSKEQCQ